MRPIDRILYLTSALVALVATGLPARAQDAALPRLGSITIPTLEPGLDLDVARRHRPEFDPVGLTLGRWRLLPSVTAGVGADSNPFGVETRREGDAFVQAEPAISAQNTFSRGEVRLDASGRFARYIEKAQANETSYRAAGYARYDIGGDTGIEGGGEFAQLIERRDSSGFPDGRVAPVRYLQTQGWLRGRYGAGRLRALGQVDYTRLDFRDARILDVDAQPIGVIDQDVRDSHSWRGTLRGEYEVGPDIAAFAQVVRSSIDYPFDLIAPGVPNLTGTATTLLGGVAFGANRLMQGSVGLGYVRRSYDAAAVRKIDGLAINADLRYFVTSLMTLSAAASRTVEEAVLQDASGYISTAASVRADYELLRPLILNAGIGYRHNDFRANPRRDEVWEASAGARYSLNRNLALEGDVSYLDRSVRNDPFAPSFGQVRLFVRTRLSL